MRGTTRFRNQRAGQWGLGLLLLGMVLSGPAQSPAQQLTPDQQADMVLNSARKAYNERNFPFAVTRFREFLAKFGNHKEAPSARYGLALSLLDSPEKDYQAALEQLQALAGMKEFPQHPFVLYYFGLAQRGLGTRELAQAVAKPQEAPQRRAAANQRFEEAAKQFFAASTAFSIRVKDPKVDAKELPPDLEWSARARCDQAEMQLRTQKAKEAQTTAAVFIKEPLMVKSRYRGLGLYYHGFASCLLHDHLTAGRSLSMLTPFNDPVFGTHARYLLARTHHLAQERKEAADHYEAVLTDYDTHKKNAVEALKQPDRFKNDPDEKARLDALVKDPAPDHVARSAFFRGVLLYEEGNFGDALARFTGFAQQYPGSPLMIEAQLRLGFCQVQLKQFAEALKALQPLADKEPRLADQALFWIGKAQVGAAEAAPQPNLAAQDQALKTPIETFRRAAEKAQQLAGTDPEAKARRGEILIEMADTQQAAHLFKDAANLYAQILNEKVLPPRDEEVLQRQATALHLAGDYPNSDQICLRFQQTYPKSSLLPAVLFRYAENAYFTALAADKNPNLPNRAAELAKLNDEVIKRYKTVVEKHPDFPQVHFASYGLAMGLLRKGELDKAKEVLETIKPTERMGDLAVVSYLLADCLIRLTPTKADDALVAGRIQEQLPAAAELLDTFVGAAPAAPQAPDALLKLGLCHQRLAAILTQPPEKAKSLASARAAYEKLMQQFPKHPLQPQAVFERAKVLAQAGDVGGAINELNRFSQDPLKAAPVAAMALLKQATLLREQKKPADAANVLNQCRQQHEQNLLRDPERMAWVPLLQYHHGLALQEAGKLAEARAVLDGVINKFAGRPEAAEGALRWGQCLKEEGMQKISAARLKLATPNLKPEEVAAANRALEEGMNALRGAVQSLETHINLLKDKQPTWETRARMLYEAAWACRTLGEPEVSAVRTKMQQEALKKQQEEALKNNPAGKPPAVVQAPDIPLSKVPLQPSEQKARGFYQALIATFSDLPLSFDARFELAELHAERDEFEPALKLLAEGLDKEPPAELADKIRIRLGVCHAAKKDIKSALAQFDAVIQNPKTTLAGQAHYRAGECLMAAGDFAKAAQRLAVFRDQGPFQNLPGLTDRALLRLGHALAQQNQWDQSRQAHEQVVNRFGQSPWVHEARYGIGWAYQNQKQFDQAVNTYMQVTQAVATELAAKAQMQIGLCRLEQKRYPEATTALLVVPFTYDYPEWNAAALSEAARAFTELKQPEQAEKLLRRVLKDHPDSKWAEVARKRLEALK